MCSVQLEYAEYGRVIKSGKKMSHKHWGPASPSQHWVTQSPGMLASVWKDGARAVRAGVQNLAEHWQKRLKVSQQDEFLLFCFLTPACLYNHLLLVKEQWILCCPNIICPLCPCPAPTFALCPVSQPLKIPYSLCLRFPLLPSHLKFSQHLFEPICFFLSDIFLLYYWQRFLIWCQTKWSISYFLCRGHRWKYQN